MAVTSSMLPLGSRAPDFSLRDTVEGGEVALSDFDDAPALLIMFICNHCPYVRHVLPELGRLAADYAPKGLAIVAINSNDVERYPDDAPEHMRELARSQGWSFPFLYDESQEVAKAYRAACTPDFFLFDAERKLAYRGRLDDSRPGSGAPLTGRDLRGAVDAVLAGRPAPGDQKPSMGCGIKWRPGNEPDDGS